MVRQTMRRIFTHRRYRAQRRRQVLRDLIVGAVVVVLVQFLAPMVPAIKNAAELPASVAVALVTPDNPEGAR
jgi:hypothetical protein